MKNKKTYNKEIEHFIMSIGIFLFFCFSITIVGATPIISIISPEEGEMYNPITWAGITLNYDDAVTCEYSSDNLDWYFFTSCYDTSNYVLLEGVDQTLYVRGTDVEENIGYAIPVTFTYDPNPPLIEIISPEKGEMYNPITWAGITLNYDDAVTCEYSSDNLDWYFFTSCYDTSNYVLLEGVDQTLYVRGTDVEENIGYAIPVTFTYNNIVYNIITCEDLQNMNDDLNGSYILLNDIDCSDTINWNEGEGFLPIGNGEDFYGNLNGQSYKITDLYINKTGQDDVGLFGYSYFSNISNINLESVYITGGENTGGLVGYKEGGIINNCNISGAIYGGSYTGGLVGFNHLGNISNSHSTANVEGLLSVGGIIGYSEGAILNSSASGTIIGTDSVGGVLGEGYNLVDNCFFIGDIIGNDWVGGLVGYEGFLGYGNSIINNSYSYPNIIGNTRIGGLIGGTEIFVLIENSYVIGNITGINKVGGLLGDNFGIINNSYVLGNVFGDYHTGGFIGQNANEGEIHNSFSSANVNFLTSVNSESLGGLTGSNLGIIINSYATGNVFGYDYVGGLSGDNGDSDKSNQGYIDNSWASGNVTGDDEVGGLVGDNTGIINNSHSSGFVNSVSNGGGLVGQNGYYILNSYSNSSVFAENEIFSYAGGLVGTCNDYDSFINNSYAIGNIEGKNGLGGLVGSLEVNCIVSNCYSVGHISGESNLGGLIGEGTGIVINSFWNIDTSGQETSSGGIGKTNSEMRSISLFTDSDWDFVNIWANNTLKNKGYPYLSWQVLEEMIPALPYFIVIPENQSIEYGIIWNGVKFDGDDETFLDDYFIDNIVNFKINKTGFLNWTGQLNGGVYYINVSINDSSGNINSTIYNLNITQISVPDIPRISGGGGGLKKIIVEQNQTNLTEINQTYQLNNSDENKSKNPSKLFDIKLELDNQIVKYSNDLSSIIRFESFGSVPTLVNLTYRIFDSSGEEVYLEEGNITVTTEEIVRNNFEDLNLLDGEYILILTTTYGENITDDFRQEFSVESKIQKNRNNFLLYFLIILIILISISLLSIFIKFVLIYKVNKDKIEREK